MAEGYPHPRPRRSPEQLPPGRGLSAPPPGALPLGRGAWIVPSRIAWSFTTARGPGGQHVNKASTAAILRVAVEDIGGLDHAATARLVAQAASALVAGSHVQIRCDLHRSQLQNREACLDRLRALVGRAAVAPKVRKKTKPSRGSVQRRLEGKKRDSKQKQQRRWSGE